MTPEGKVKARVKAHLDPLVTAGVLWYFMPIGGMFAKKGAPDFVGSYKGKFFALETKAAGGKLTKLQEMEHAKIRTTGVVAMYVLSDDENSAEWICFRRFLSNEK